MARAASGLDTAVFTSTLRVKSFAKTAIVISKSRGQAEEVTDRAVTATLRRKLYHHILFLGSVVCLGCQDLARVGKGWTLGSLMSNPSTKEASRLYQAPIMVSVAGTLSFRSVNLWNRDIIGGGRICHSHRDAREERCTIICSLA